MDSKTPSKPKFLDRLISSAAGLSRKASPGRSSSSSRSPRGGGGPKHRLLSNQESSFERSDPSDEGEPEEEEREASREDGGVEVDDRRGHLLEEKAGPASCPTRIAGAGSERGGRACAGRATTGILPLHIHDDDDDQDFHRHHHDIDDDLSRCPHLHSQPCSACSDERQWRSRRSSYADRAASHCNHSSSSSSDCPHDPAVQQGTSCPRSPSSPPLSPVIPGLVRQRCENFRRLSDQAVRSYENVLERGRCEEREGERERRCFSPVTEKADRLVKSFYGLSRDKSFSKAVMEKGYVRALAEQINTGSLQHPPGDPDLLDQTGGCEPLDSGDARLDSPQQPQQDSNRSCGGGGGGGNGGHAGVADGKPGLHDDGVSAAARPRTPDCRSFTGHVSHAGKKEGTSPKCDCASLNSKSPGGGSGGECGADGGREGGGGEGDHCTCRVGSAGQEKSDLPSLNCSNGSPQAWLHGGSSRNNNNNNNKSSRKPCRSQSEAVARSACEDSRVREGSPSLKRNASHGATVPPPTRPPPPRPEHRHSVSPHRHKSKSKSPPESVQRPAGPPPSPPPGRKERSKSPEPLTAVTPNSLELLATSGSSLPGSPSSSSSKTSPSTPRGLKPPVDYSHKPKVASTKSVGIAGTANNTTAASVARTVDVKEAADLSCGGSHSHKAKSPSPAPIPPGPVGGRRSLSPPDRIRASRSPTPTKPPGSGSPASRRKEPLQSPAANRRKKTLLCASAGRGQGPPEGKTTMSGSEEEGDDDSPRTSEGRAGSWDVPQLPETLVHRSGRYFTPESGFYDNVFISGEGGGGTHRRHYEELFDKSWESESDFSEQDENEEEEDRDVQEVERGDVESETEESSVILEQVIPIEATPPSTPRDRLHQIAHELLTTERAYVKRLHLLHQIFYFRLDQENRAQNFLPQDVLNQMFSSIESIHRFHNDFLLKELEERMIDWENKRCIGDLMKNNAPFLKLYTAYVKNFDNAMNLINSWLEKSPKFAAIVHEIQKMPECGSLSLQHHMLEPIQRVPRYELLLKDYLKNLPHDSPDRGDAQTALDLVTKAASHSNEAMKKIEKFHRLLDIYQRLRGVTADFICPTRDFVREGPITKISARSGEKQSRYLFLFNDLLLICSEPILGAYRVRAQLDVDGMELKKADNLALAHTFLVHSKQKAIELLDENPSAIGGTRVGWHELLKEVIHDYRNRKCSLMRSESSLPSPTEMESIPGKQAPRWIPDDAATMCMMCQNTFSMVRRRHHCRGCGKLICKGCSKKAPLEYMNNKLERVCVACYDFIVYQGQGRAGEPTSPSGGDTSPTKKRGILQVKANDPGLLAGYLLISEDLGKSWLKRWFSLHEDFVMYFFKARQDVSAYHSLPLPGYHVEIVSDPDKPHAFRIHHKGVNKKGILFRGDNEKIVKKWVNVLGRLVMAQLPDETQRLSSQSNCSSASSNSGGSNSDTTTTTTTSNSANITSSHTNNDDDDNHEEGGHLPGACSKSENLSQADSGCVAESLGEDSVGDSPVMMGDEAVDDAGEEQP